MPGQLGPTNRVFPWVLSMLVTRTMSCWGMPSVMQTTRGISAATASSIDLAATGGLIQPSADSRVFDLVVAHGTKIAEAVAPVSLIASATEANTGFPRCVSPAFLGLVPPTTFVPGDCQLLFQWSSEEQSADRIRLLAEHGT